MKKIHAFLAALALGLGVAAFNPYLALAADQAPTISINAPSGFENLQKISYSTIISASIKLILIAAALVFFFILVIGGIQWIISGGDKAGTETARKRITNALIGLVIVFAAWAIISLINVLFGIDIFNLTPQPFYQP